VRNELGKGQDRALVGFDREEKKKHRKDERTTPHGAKKIAWEGTRKKNGQKKGEFSGEITAATKKKPGTRAVSCTWFPRPQNKRKGPGMEEKGGTSLPTSRERGTGTPSNIFRRSHIYGEKTPLQENKIKIDTNKMFPIPEIPELGGKRRPRHLYGGLCSTGLKKNRV